MAPPPRPPMPVAMKPNMFNPPNPNATGMNFNNQNATGMNFNNGRPGSNQGASASIDPYNAQMPSIGASLVDQEAVSLAPNLMGKKKKKKAKKKIDSNSYMDDGNLDLPGTGYTPAKINIR